MFVIIYIFRSWQSGRARNAQCQTRTVHRERTDAGEQYSTVYAREQYEYSTGTELFLPLTVQ